MFTRNPLSNPLSPTGLALTSLLALVACDGPETSPSTAATTGEDGPRDTLVIGFQSDADQLMSVVYQTASDGHVMSGIFAHTQRAQMGCELTYEPYLAKEWTFSEDGTQIAMTLQEGFTWADGTPVTAEDFAFTYDLIRDPIVASPRLTYTEHMTEDSPVVLSDYELLWKFTRAYDRITMTAHVGLDPVPAHMLQDADRATLRGHPLVRKPLVNGPFKLEQWQPNEKIVLVPNENFTGPEEFKPKLNRVIFKILPEYATRLVELENGATDVAQGILVADADRLLKEHPEITLHRRGWRSMDYVAWNRFDFDDYKSKKTALGADAQELDKSKKTALGADAQELDWSTVEEHHIFGDRAVRRAFAKAVSVDKLMADLLTSETGEVFARRSVSTITPALCNTHNNDIQPMPYDVAAANAELEAAGWVDTNGDGLREKNGKELAFTLMTNSGNARRAKGAIIMQAQLKDVGAKVEIETVESNTFFERMRKKDFEAALSGWSAALFVDMSNMWKSGEKFEFNFPSYENDEVDALIEQALTEPDPTKNSALWRRVQALIYEDQPYMFLYWMDEIVGVHSRFENAQVNVMSPFDQLWTWSVPADKVKYKR